MLSLPFVSTPQSDGGGQNGGLPALGTPGLGQQQQHAPQGSWTMTSQQGQRQHSPPSQMQSLPAMSMYFPTAMQAPFTPQPLGLAGTSFVPAGYGGILPAAGGPITVMGHPQQNIYLGHQAMQQMQPTGMPFGQFSVLPGFGGGSAAQIPGVGMMTFRQPQSMTVMQQQQAGSTIGGDNSFLLPPATVDYFNANLAMGSYKAGMAGAGAGPLGQQNSSAAMVPMNTSSGGGLWSNNLGGQMMYNNPAGGGQSGLQMMKQPGGMPSSTQQPMAPPSNNNSYDPNNSRHANANNKAKIKREHSEDAEGDDDEEFDSNEEDEQEDISDGTDEYRPRKSRSKRSRISGGSSSRRRQRITGTTLASAQQARALPLPPSPTTTAPYDDYMASLRVPHLDRAEREAMGDKPKPFRCNVCGLRFGSSGHLSRHGYIHKPQHLKPHACPIAGCDRRFPRSDNMRVHYRAHLKQLARDGQPVPEGLPNPEPNSGIGIERQQEYIPKRDG